MNTSPTTSPPLSLLQDFLGHFDLAATAHAREELTQEQKNSLAAFANGELTETERKALIPLLAHNTTALEHLAALLKGETPEGE